MQTMRRWWTGISRSIKPKSNGVPISRSTAVHVRSADQARARQDWVAAASAYRLALTKEPHLHHLWVQLGHVEKEAGAIERAAAAYDEAARLRPDDVEPLLHLGHMAKAWHQPAEAAVYFIRALQCEGHNLQAMAELSRLMPDYSNAPPELWSSALRALDIDSATRNPNEPSPLPPESIILDVTDLLAFFGYRRLPTGIQRVQIEIALAVCGGVRDFEPVFCLYSGARRGWIRFCHDDFIALCQLAKQSDDVDDPRWKSQLYQIYRSIAISRTIIFSPGAILINLGTSWSDRNYLLDIRSERVRNSIIYIPLVFDLIPLIGPEWFAGSLVRDYRTWFGSLLHSADGCIAISQATCQDLMEKSAQWHVPLPACAVQVVRLDGDFRQNSATANILRDHDLQASGYVLLVSTLEPRKNHIGAFYAWLKLADMLGEEAVPSLVCVGGRGWLNDDLHLLMRDKPQLKRMVRILHGVSDNELATLYEHCLFALYPSFYEGWGLPVSEALSYGKVPAISNTSSLPEAGGPYALYFDPHDVSAIAATVRILLDDDVRSAAEAVIKRDHAPRTWRQIAQDLVTKAQMITPRLQDTLPRITGEGSWSLAICAHKDDDAFVGEALRYGHGWLAPTSAGCKVSGDDAALWFHWSGLACAQLHIYVAEGSGLVNVSLNNTYRTTFSLRNEPAIISLPMPAVPGPVQVDLVPPEIGFVVERFTITCGEELQPFDA